jgi:hypothetical protein
MDKRRIAFAVLALAAMALVTSGCLHLDGEVFKVSILNDTAEPVVLRDCASYCSSSPLVFNLGPGASTPVNRVANDHKFFSIKSASGEHLGCLDLYFKAPQPGRSVFVSDAVACPAGSRMPWKTVGPLLLVFVPLLAFLLVRILRRPRSDRAS